MKIYYRGSPIGEVSTKEEADKFIRNYQKENYNHFHSLLKESENLTIEAKKIRESELGESLEEYFISVKENNPEFFERLEAFGETFYGDRCIDIYFVSPSDGLLGFVLKDGDKTSYSGIETLGLEICSYYALSEHFEIKD